MHPERWRCPHTRTYNQTHNLIDRNTNIFHLYTNKYINTHLKKSLTVYLLRKYLAGLDMEREKCWKLSGWANIIFLKEVAVVPRLRPCCFMLFNNYLVLVIKSLRYRGEMYMLLIWGICCFLYEVLLQLKGKGVSFIKYLTYKVPPLPRLSDNIQLQKRSMIALMFSLKVELL